MKKADTDDYMFYDFAYTKHKKRKARTSLSSVVKNLPPNAGDTGSIPSRKTPHAKGQLSPHATITEAQLPRTCGLKQNEKPVHHS